jgi:hypothetical protein
MVGRVPVGYSGFPAYSRMLTVTLLPQRATKLQRHLRTVPAVTTPFGAGGSFLTTSHGRP